jgi:hypothetical protein
LAGPRVLRQKLLDLFLDPGVTLVDPVTVTQKLVGLGSKKSLELVQCVAVIFSLKARVFVSFIGGLTGN